MTPNDVAALAAQAGFASKNTDLPGGFHPYVFLFAAKVIEAHTEEVIEALRNKLSGAKVADQAIIDTLVSAFDNILIENEKRLALEAMQHGVNKPN